MMKSSPERRSWSAWRSQANSNARLTASRSISGGESNSSTTLSPVPLQDDYDQTKVDFVSATPAPTSVDTVNGIISIVTKAGTAIV